MFICCLLLSSLPLFHLSVSSFTYTPLRFVMSSFVRKFLLYIYSIVFLIECNEFVKYMCFLSLLWVMPVLFKVLLWLSCRVMASSSRPRSRSRFSDINGRLFYLQLDLEAIKYFYFAILILNDPYFILFLFFHHSRILATLSSCHYFIGSGRMSWEQICALRIQVAMLLGWYWKRPPIVDILLLVMTT